MGSALLVDQDSGQLRLEWLTSLIEDLLRLRKRGQQVILVSSGAIALGRRELGLAQGRCGLMKARPPLRWARSVWPMPTRSCWASMA